MFLPGYFFWWGIYFISVCPLVLLVGFFCNKETQVPLILASLLWGLVVLSIVNFIYKSFCHKVENAQRHEKELFGGMLDYLPLAIITIDSQGIITFINSHGEEILGLKREQEIGRPIQAISCENVLLDGSNSLFDLMGDTLHRGIVYHEVELGAFINGNQGTVKISTCILKGKEQPAGVLLVLTDYTVGKFLEEQVQRNECLSVVGQMAAGICHEIRNPLQSVKGFVQLLQEKNKCNQDVSSYTEIVISEINRISSIIKEFLQLARPSTIKFERRDINSLVRDVVMLVNSEAILRNVVIEERYGKKMPYLMLDEPRIKQVLINILSNALAAIPCAGTIEVATWYDFHLNEARISIADNGVGMDQDTIEHIGSPFFTTKEEGTGLGLAVSYRIIQDHGGRIMVESFLGKGTTFIIVLPELAGLGEKIRGFSP